MLLLPHKLAPCSGGTQRLNLYWVVSLRLVAVAQSDNVVGRFLRKQTFHFSSSQLFPSLNPLPCPVLGITRLRCRAQIPHL